MSKPVVTLLYAERVGAVDRILSLLRRRAFPVGGTTIERTHRPGVGRMSILIASPAAAEQIRRHLERLPDVLEASIAEPEDAVQRELAVIRVHCGDEMPAALAALIEEAGARTISTRDGQAVIEVSGSSASIDDFFTRLAPFGIEESGRTSPLALRHGSVDGRESA